MQLSKSLPHRKPAAGFTLPAILVVVGALLILAVGILLVVGIERNTAHSFADRARAELAARAGLEDIRGVLTQEAANDDFLILQGTDPVSGSKKDPLPYLYLARGSGGGTAVKYRYLPLFSTATQPATPSSGTTLEAPKPKDLIGGDPKEFTTLPWCDPGKVAWVQIPDVKGKIVSRYAYWVEDLQSRVDAGTAGNTKDGGAHKRYGWKAGDTSKFARFPAPGLNAEDSKPGSDGRDAEPPLDQVALYEVDPATGAKDDSDLDKTIIDGRKALVSPDSVLAVAGVIPPLTRGTDGHLADAKARAVEENLTASVRPYDEQPVVPYAKGIDASVSGKPKLNLNALIAMPPANAVDEMAAWIKKGLPTFDVKQPGTPGSRSGGFPEDYVKTLAASAIGYAAPGNQPVVKMGEYRGLGASPMLSEIVLDINYLGYVTKDGSKIMQYQFVLFAELLNHTNLPIQNGKAALSFEVGLPLPAIGPIPAGTRFDELLGDPTQCTHDLSPADGRYWSQPQTVNLAPGEYKFYKFATANYTINIGSSSTGSQFTLTEKLGAAGLSMKWNDKEVERIPSIVRDPTGLTFSSGLKRYFGKAAIPGHSYGPFGEFINNMGDPRIAHFIRFKGGSSNSTNGIPLGENSFPENISPNRRNIRYKTAYSTYGPTKLQTYGRVIPSEWPDCGHDAQVTTWDSGWTAARQGSSSTNGTGPGFDPTTIGGAVLPEAGEALTYLSDRGRYYSATELGRLYDPIMFVPTFDPASPLNSITLRGVGEPTDKAGIMPASGIPWPLVQIANVPSLYFGGGNTLRIGRPEHPKFDQPAKHVPVDMPGTHAARLLDLFHAGKSRSADVALREGPVIRVEGQVNINTASRDALRSMAAGFLAMDPKLLKRTSDNFDGRMAPAIQPLSTLSAPTTTKEADRIADAVINGRPYATPSELACAAGTDGKQVFGNSDLYPDKNKVQWSDSAAEEVFGRVYEASTVRSRNFRVWVIGQAISPTSPTNTTPGVLGEVRKVFTVFANPGERKNDGTIDPTKSRITILHENDF
jgi:Tfp pilus assembly protein PilV